MEGTDSYPELRGKTAIVTGAGSGIGKSVALLLAKEGVNVAVVENNVKKGREMEMLLRQEGTRACFTRCDVTVPQDIEASFGTILNQFGVVNILVNCVGGFNKVTPVTEYSVTEWDNLMNLNLRSAFLFTRLVLPGMMQQHWGRIVNISSGSAQGVPYITSAIYTAAKAGMLGFTRHVAAEVARYGVTVNATAPGVTRTERIEKLYAGRFDEKARTVPVGRLAEPEEQAAVVVFLCSNKAAYITGATIAVNGGMIFS